LPEGLQTIDLLTGFAFTQNQSGLQEGLPMAEKKITQKELETYVRGYTRVQSKYEEYGRHLRTILEEIKNKFAPTGFVDVRAKHIASYAEKIMRKQKYRDPLHEITDLIGGRIIVKFQNEVEQIEQYIRAHFNIDEVNCTDKRTELGLCEFGYLSIHLIVMPKQGSRFFSTAQFRTYQNIKAEIQIRTLLQHAWADISHDRLYKTPIDVPSFWRRETSRLAAILEEADKSFEKFAETLDAFSSGYMANLTEQKLNEEIDKFKILFNASEEDAVNQKKYAFKLIQLYQVQGKWLEIIDLFEKLDSDQQADVLIKIAYGIAKCRQKPVNEHLNLLNEIARYQEPLKEKSALDNPSPDHSDDTQRRCRAKAANALGYFYKVKNSMANAQKCCKLAYELVPDNPYYLTDLLEVEIALKRSKDPILNPAIRDAIEMCREHIKYNIEVPKCYWTMGKLYFILNDIDNACFNFTKAIDICNNQNPIFPASVYEDQLGSYENLRLAVNAQIDCQVIHALLLLGQFKHPKTGQKIKRKIIGIFDTLIRQKNETRKEMDEDSRIVIVAGGCADLLDYYNRYEEILKDAFMTYQGIVISGGTESGIPGKVAEAIQSINKKRNTSSPAQRKLNSIKLLGYLPKKLPSDEHGNAIQRHQGYQYVTFLQNTNNFSILDIISYWIDIAVKNVNMDHVKVLGINGGRFTDLEYKIALAMGAQVGLIENSGRAVTGIMQDPEWSDHPNIVVLPCNKITIRSNNNVILAEGYHYIWVFINQNQNYYISEGSCRNEKNAALIHNAFRSYLYESGQSTEAGWEYYKTDEDKQELIGSNFNQLKYIECIMLKSGYLSDYTDKEKLERFFSDDVACEAMAVLEHARWYLDRLLQGWRYGRTKDTRLKTNPYMIDWDKLDEKTKGIDRTMVKNWEKIIDIYQNIT
jgi:ppGpp synthetase/RelA/SpoT-type nucleotidyltranferase